MCLMSYSQTSSRWSKFSCAKMWHHRMFPLPGFCLPCPKAAQSFFPGRIHQINQKVFRKHILHAKFKKGKQKKKCPFFPLWEAFTWCHEMKTVSWPWRLLLIDGFAPCHWSTVAGQSWGAWSESWCWRKRRLETNSHTIHQSSDHLSPVPAAAISCLLVMCVAVWVFTESQ